MCYKLEVQEKNRIKLEKKLDEIELPLFMRKYFTIKIESKSGALNYLGVIKDILLYFIEEKIIEKNNISELEPSDFSNVMAEDITLYLRTKENNGMSPTTLETRKNIIRSFWKYLSRIKECNISDNFCDDVTYKGISSNGNIIKKFPTDLQLKNMEEKILRKKDIFIRNRNIAVFRLLKGTGIRELELAGLDLEDLHLDAEIPYITIVGKGVYRKIQQRIVYLTNSACNAISEWLDYRNEIENIVDKNAVFLNKNGKRMNEENIKSIFKTYGYGMTPHMMRHWYATFINSKSNIAFAQQQLGHSSEKTTISNYTNGVYEMKDILKNM